MGNVLSPYSFSLQGGYPQGTDPETYGVYEHTFGGWEYGAQNGSTIELVSNNELKGTYGANRNGVDVWANYTLVDRAASEVFLEFSAKMPNFKWGCKFFKIRGQDSGNNYANTTMALDIDGTEIGGFYQVIFGDGSVVENDANNALYFVPPNAQAGRSTPTISTPQGVNFTSSEWGEAWHDFKIHVKFNSGTTSGNEVADGEVYVEIDGNVYLAVTGLFNRHYSNLPIDRISFFNYTDGNGENVFDISYKNPRVSTTGFS